MEDESKQEKQDLDIKEDEKPESAQNKKVSNFQELKHRAKKLPWYAKGTAATLALVATIAGGVKATEELKNNDSSPNVPTAAETITPTPASTQEPQITPIQESSPTPINTSSTPTSSPETPTPTPTQPQETETVASQTPETKENYSVIYEIGEGINTQKVEDAKTTIEKAWKNFPQVGHFKIILVPGIASSILINPPEQESHITYGVDTFGQSSILNELSAFYTQRANPVFFEINYTPQQLEKIITTEQIILDTYGNFALDNIISAETIADKGYLHVVDTAFSLYTAQSVGIPISGEIQNYPLQNLLFEQQLNNSVFTNIATRHTAEQNQYLNPMDFVRNHPQEWQEIKSASPFLNYVMTKLEAKGNLLKNVTSYSQNFNAFNSQDTADYFERVIPKLINLEATELWRLQEQDFLDLLSNEQKTEINSNYDYLVDRMLNEIMARAINMQIQEENNNLDVSNYLSLIQETY